MSPDGQYKARLAELPAVDASQRLDLVREWGEPDDVMRSLAETAEQLAVTDAGLALSATECLVPLADSLGSPLGRSLARRARAHALCNSGRLEEGWLMCDQAAQLAEQAGKPVEAGRARLRSMQALGELARFDRSITAGEQARAAFLAAGEDTLAARADVNLGIVYQRRDEPARAIEYFDRARPHLGDSPLAIGTVDNNRGEALVALNDFEGARAAFESALANCEQADATLLTAIALGNLADLAARQGLLHRAVVHFERARRRFETAQSSGHLSRLLTEQAEAMSVLGLPGDALKLYESALPQLDRAGQALEAARARAGLGRTLVRLRRFSEAETALAAAAMAFDQLGHATSRARVDLMRAELAAANGLRGEARRLIHGALAVLHDRPIDAATAHHLLAQLSLDDGVIDEAEAQIATAMSLARRLELAPLQSDILHTAARLRRRQRDHATAVANLEEAVAQIERVRSTMHAQRFRGAYLGDRLAVYEDLIGVLLETGGPAATRRAFMVAEQAKSRGLLEQVRGDLDADETPETDDPDQQRLVDDFVRVRARLNAMYSRLADDDQAGGSSWQRSVIDDERRLEMLESRLSTTRGEAGLYARPADLETVAAALGDSTTLIEYTRAGDELIAFVVHDNGDVVARSLCQAGLLDDHLARLQFQMNRALRPTTESWRSDRLLDDVRAELGALDQMLMAPVRDEIEANTRLLIVPHGPLHLLPFHALWDGQRHLIEEHEIHYAPSASVYAHLPRRQEPTDVRRSLVVGVADALAPNIEQEARELAARLGGASTLLTGAKATVSRFRDAVGTADLVHLACHARYAPTTPLGSGVRLADGWLTVRDIFSTRIEADLVTLSGCETGRSLVHTGDELTGLLRGFLAAGASSLLVSLWRVDDTTTADLMQDYYQAWLSDSNTKAAALRDAQIRALARTPHPAFWAPFELVGRS